LSIWIFYIRLAIPLWLAFTLARRTANRRFTYGYGRAEDLAGVLIVLMIFGSAVVVFYEFTPPLFS
jgi:divalent metal cation (Fe/Co/Zn/Cd) transporter